MTEYKKWVDAAARLARKLHTGQSDKSGVDYFSGHLTAVANQGRTWLEQILGYLHDSTEDTSHTMDEVLTLLEQEAVDTLPRGPRQGIRLGSESIESSQCSQPRSLY